MKIVINKCYGGFRLSPKALNRAAELQGKECYFFELDYKAKKYIPLSLEEASKRLFSIAFNVSNPNEIYKEPENWHEMSMEEKEKSNKSYESIEIEDFRDDNKRSDPILIQVVEELGDDASSKLSKLKIVEIPDGIEYEIEEYDGLEHIAEIHQTWD